MSVETRMDELRDGVKSLLKQAIEKMTVMLDESTWGHGEYNDSYIDKVADFQQKLRIMKREL